MKRILGVSQDWMDSKPYLMAVPFGYIWAEADWDHRDSKHILTHEQFLVNLDYLDLNANGF